MVWSCSFGPVIDQKIIAKANGERLEEAGFLLSFLGSLRDLCHLIWLCLKDSTISIPIIG